MSKAGPAAVWKRVLRCSATTGTPVEGQLEGGIELRVADRRTGAPEEHHVGRVGLGQLDPFEILTEVAFVDDQAAGTGVGARPGSGPRSVTAVRTWSTPTRKPASDSRAAIWLRVRDDVLVTSRKGTSWHREATRRSRAHRATAPTTRSALRRCRA